jgi:hypothetical protein
MCKPFSCQNSKVDHSTSKSLVWHAPSISSLVLEFPGAHGGSTSIRIDLDIGIVQQARGTDSADQTSSECHDGDQRIGGGIREPGLSHGCIGAGFPLFGDKSGGRLETTLADKSSLLEGGMQHDVQKKKRER